MKASIRCTIVASAAAASLAGLPGHAQQPATDYPAHPIRLIVGFPVGQSSDILCRLIGAKLAEVWGQQVVIDNRPGAGGSIGTEMGAKAPADGYTLTMAASGPHGINPSFYPKLGYDAVKDFAPITDMASVAQTMVVNPSSQVKSVADLVALAKAKPGQVNHASPGNGTTSHLTMEMFKTAAGIRMTHVPYKGSPPAFNDIIGGQITVMFDAMPAVLPFVRSGKLKAIAVSTAKRSPFLPDLPTIAESGYPGFDTMGWIGLVAPAGTPEPILEKLNLEVVRIINSRETKERFAAMAFEPIGDTRSEFSAFIKSEIAKWGKAVRDSGARAD